MTRERPPPPRRIVRGGLVYQLTAESTLADIIERKRHSYPQEDSYPPPERIWGKPSPAQSAMLTRIQACPFPIRWGGMLFRNEPSARVDLQYAPKLNGATVRCLWRLGLIERTPGTEHGQIRPSQRSWQHERPHRLAYERLRWRALAELCPELEAAWARYRALDSAAYQASKMPGVHVVPHDLPRPPNQVRERDIRARMRAIRERDPE